MKKAIKSAGLILLAVCVILSASLIPGIISSSDDSVSARPLPVLTASITSPANGSVLEAGQCFQVTATVTATCPDGDQELTSSGFPFSMLVYAEPNGCYPAASNVNATITIQGNAQVQGSATQQSSAPLYCDDPGCQNTANFSWPVCCTGEGTVTITVTPAGDLPIAKYDGDSIGVTRPVYASIDSSPLPAENLVSDSITITQKKSFYQKMKADQGSPTWARPSSMTTLNTWTQTQTARAGQEVVIYANVANRGDMEGPYTATLTINGVVEEVKTGMLQGNTAVPLKFVVTMDEPGTYNVDVNGKQTYFTVTGDSSRQASQAGSHHNTGFIVLLILFIALIAALVALIVRRRQQYSSQRTG